MDNINTQIQTPRPSTSSAPQPQTTKILEINLISAQNLTTSTNMRRMHTYAIIHIHPSTKLRSTLDIIGNQNPTWNDKFFFRVAEDFLISATSAVTFQIYAVGYLRDYFVGTARYLLSSSSISSRNGAVIGLAGFSALHIRRKSGRVNGVLNIAATVYNSDDFPSLSGVEAICFRDMIAESDRRLTRFLNSVGAKNDGEVNGKVKGKDNGKRGVETSEGEESGCVSEAGTAVKGGNGLKLNILAGKSGGLLCGLVSPKRSGPLDQNVVKMVKD
ncbi:C2 calcium-dependent membrane-targeting protein [Tanacetum coccineum]